LSGWLPLLLWWVAVPWLLLSPIPDDGLSLPGWLLQILPRPVVVALDTFADKVVHGVLFGLGAALLHRLPMPLALAVLVSAAYGGAMELLQLSFPPRTGDGWDALANLTGAVLYAALVLGIRHGRGIR
jgi:hypothetical protein